jgi:hypothetical protein
MKAGNTTPTGKRGPDGEYKQDGEAKRKRRVSWFNSPDNEWRKLPSKEKCMFYMQCAEGALSYLGLDDDEQSAWERFEHNEREAVWPPNQRPLSASSVRHPIASPLFTSSPIIDGSTSGRFQKATERSENSGATLTATVLKSRTPTKTNTQRSSFSKKLPNSEFPT